MLEMVIAVLFAIVKIIGLVILAGAGLVCIALVIKIFMEILRYERKDV